MSINKQEKKCVMIIDENLPLGIIANTAAVMGVTLGKENNDIVGTNVNDGTGKEHLGIIEFPIPILKGNPKIIKEVRAKLYSHEYAGLTVVDFSDVAQSCKSYDEFISQMKEVDEKDLNYLGLALCGSKKLVNKLTGSMPLLK